LPGRPTRPWPRIPFQWPKTSSLSIQRCRQLASGAYCNEGTIGSPGWAAGDEAWGLHRRTVKVGGCRVLGIKNRGNGLAIRSADKRSETGFRKTTAPSFFYTSHGDRDAVMERDLEFARGGGRFSDQAYNDGNYAEIAKGTSNPARAPFRGRRKEKKIRSASWMGFEPAGVEKDGIEKVRKKSDRRKERRGQAVRRGRRIRRFSEQLVTLSAQAEAAGAPAWGVVRIECLERVWANFGGQRRWRSVHRAPRGLESPTSGFFRPFQSDAGGPRTFDLHRVERNRSGAALCKHLVQRAWPKIVVRGQDRS